MGAFWILIIKSYIWNLSARPHPHRDINIRKKLYPHNTPTKKNCRNRQIFMWKFFKCTFGLQFSKCYKSIRQTHREATSYRFNWVFEKKNAINVLILWLKKTFPTENLLGQDHFMYISNIHSWCVSHWEKIPNINIFEMMMVSKGITNAYSKKGRTFCMKKPFLSVNWNFLPYIFQQIADISGALQFRKNRFSVSLSEFFLWQYFHI